MGKWTLLSVLFLSQQEQRREFASAVDAAIQSLTRWDPANPPARSDDVEFVHRLTMDLVGRKPTDEEVRAFTADADPKKREKAIDRLVAAPEFGPFWGRRLAEAFLGDLSEVRMERIDGVTPPAAAKIVDRFAAWLGEQLVKDRPFPEIVREMIEARGKSDETPALGYKLAHFRGNGYPREFATGLSRGLLGVRIYCAQCHDHPFDVWNEKHFYGLAAFVGREGAQRVGFTDQVELRASPSGGVDLGDGKTAKPLFLFGDAPAEGEDGAKSLASFVTKAGSAQLSKTLVNRVWAWLFRRGLVHPPDDFNKMVLPASTPALDALSRGFADNHYSLKKLLEELCRTRVYQVADPKGPSEEDAVYVRGFRKGWRERPVPKDFPKFAVPEGWTVYVGPDRSPRPVYRIPDKEKKTGDALLYWGLGGGDEIVNQMGPAKPRTETVQGKQAVTLTEVKGTYPCDRIAGAPLENYHAVIGRVGKAGRGSFRLEGPADTVADWRDEFLELLKGIEP